MPRARARAVTQGLAERGPRVLQGALALFVTRLGRAPQVVARLLAEVLLDGLGDHVGDHRFECGNEGFLRGLQHRLQDLLRNFLEELPQDHARGGGRAHRADLRQAQGERRGGLRRRDFDREDDQLRDHGDLQPDDEHRRGIHADGDHLGALAGVVQVAGTAGELLPGLVEPVDGVTGVLRENVSGGGQAA
ncbi:hypothetical protein [Streptomyces sp. NPDC004856]|uniref:hypothetical protein n=1 Tax=Streptomyces sp. NPDC004856 TaxID=3154556 RepID=UPI0033ACA054